MICSICYNNTTNVTRCHHTVCLQCSQKIYRCPICRRSLNIVSFADDVRLWIGILLCSVIIVTGSMFIYMQAKEHFILLYIFGICASIGSVHLLTNTHVTFPAPEQHELL